MATRFYLLNSAAPYTPATNKGSWDEDDSGGSAIKIDTSQSGGTAATANVQENQSTTNWDVLAIRGISDGLPYTQELSGTLDYALMLDKTFNFDQMYVDIHIWVTQGDSDTARGTLLSNHVGNDNWANNPTTAGESGVSINTVSAVAGDRIVFEIGARHVNTTGLARGGNVYYGGTSGDQTEGSTDTTQFSWIEFSFDLEAGAPSQWTGDIYDFRIAPIPRLI